MTYRYFSFRDKKYCWATSKNNDGLWAAWVQTAPGSVDRKRTFVKRASAKRCAKRWRDAHERRNEQQRERSKCNKCGEHVKIKGDYLCGECRYG